MRHSISIEKSGSWLRGTYHCPDFEKGEEASQIGIFMGSPGYLPRSSQGDLAAHLADKLSAAGFPVFRFDMPGIGDSDGDLPEDVLSYFQLVARGGHAQAVGFLVNNLVCRYGLKGMILAGHCGGATSAVYAAEMERHSRIKGLILIEPNFELHSLPVKSANPQWAVALRKTTCKHGDLLWSKLRASLLRSDWGEKVLCFYSRFRTARDQVRGPRLPSKANLQLIESWKRVQERRLPTLIFGATATWKRSYLFDYPSYLGFSSQSHFKFIQVEGAAHSFVEGDGRPAVLFHSENWVRTNFPLQRQESPCRAWEMNLP